VDLQVVKAMVAVLLVAEAMVDHQEVLHMVVAKCKAMVVVAVVALLMEEVVQEADMVAPQVVQKRNHHHIKFFICQ